MRANLELGRRLGGRIIQLSEHSERQPIHHDCIENLSRLYQTRADVVHAAITKQLIDRVGNVHRTRTTVQTRRCRQD